MSNHLKTEVLIDTMTNHLNNEDPKIKTENIKLFYCGKKLKEDEDLWTHNINEEEIIQIFT